MSTSCNAIERFRGGGRRGGGRRGGGRRGGRRRGGGYYRRRGYGYGGGYGYGYGYGYPYYGYPYYNGWYNRPTTVVVANADDKDKDTPPVVVAPQQPLIDTNTLILMVLMGIGFMIMNRK